MACAGTFPGSWSLVSGHRLTAQDDLLGQAAEDAPPQRLNDVLAPQQPPTQVLVSRVGSYPPCTGGALAWNCDTCPPGGAAG